LIRPPWLHGQTADLIIELEDWKQRALDAEARAAALEKKLAGERKRNDPREKLERKLKRWTS
jgi:hypothetical protein